jgi:hypothetical protein
VTLCDRLREWAGTLLRLCVLAGIAIAAVRWIVTRRVMHSGFVRLLLLTAWSTLWPLVVLAVGVGGAMVLGLMAYDRMARRCEARADRLVTKAEAPPANVVYLTEELAQQARESRLLRLVERA